MHAFLYCAEDKKRFWIYFFFLYYVCLIVFLLRKFLCLGDPLCVANKTAMQSQLDNPLVKDVSNGAYLFGYNNLMSL